MLQGRRNNTAGSEEVAKPNAPPALGSGMPKVSSKPSVATNKKTATLTRIRRTTMPPVSQRVRISWLMLLILSLPNVGMLNKIRRAHAATF